MKKIKVQFRISDVLPGEERLIVADIIAELRGKYGDRVEEIGENGKKQLVIETEDSMDDVRHLIFPFLASNDTLIVRELA